MLTDKAVMRLQQDHNRKNTLCSREPYTNVTIIIIAITIIITMFFGEDIYVKLTQHIIGVLKLNK